MDGKRLLVVDDDQQICDLFVGIFGDEFEVMQAKSGEEALKKAVLDHPNGILLDVMMDSMTTGFELSRTIRNPDPASEYAAYRTIPLVMITAIHATASLRFASDKAQLPVDAFVEKPIEPELLLSIVRDHIGKYRP